MNPHTALPTSRGVTHVLELERLRNCAERQQLTTSFLFWVAGCVKWATSGAKVESSDAVLKGWSRALHGYVRIRTHGNAVFMGCADHWLPPCVGCDPGACCSPESVPPTALHEISDETCHDSETTTARSATVLARGAGFDEGWREVCISQGKQLEDD